MGKRVGLSWNHITKRTVDGPGIESFRNLFVTCCIVVVLVEVLVLPSLCDITIIVNLVIGILSPGARKRQQ